jgi:shikimate dehydrogenase
VRKFGLTGYPLSYSFSRKYFAQKFAREGITGCTYENYPLASIDLFPGLVSSLEGLEGLNVTIPYKEAIIPFLDRLDETASAVGAVNTIVFGPDGTTGCNTDVTGFLVSLRPLLRPHHTRALILGTGGASKAVAFALHRLGIASRFVSRTPREGQLGYIDLDEDIMGQHTVIVNTTPLGTSPDTEQAPPLPYLLLSPAHLLYDLVYNPPETLFLRLGRERGAATRNGSEMLVLQAEASWKIWNSVSR